MQLIQQKSNASVRLYIEMTVLFLMAAGTVFVVSAGANVRSGFTLRNFYDFTTLKQLLFFPIAIALMYAVSCIDYKIFSLQKPAYKSMAVYIFAVSVVLLALVLVPGIGVEKNESRRWLDLVPGSAVSVSFQPSELAKWAMVILMAALLDKFSDSIKLYWKRFVPLCIVVGLVAGMIITQDFGTAAFIMLIAALMMFVGKVRFWHFLTPLPIIIPLLAIAILSSPTRVNRIRAYLNPDATEIAANYQASQSLIAISTGGITGKGLGQGVSKYGHLPEDTTDFIFAIIAEELGFVGATVIILVFVAFVILSMVIISRCRDPLGKLLASGVVMTIAIQAAVNIGVVTAVLPTKGIPLPFISAGGTSLLLTAGAVGLLLNVAKRSEPTNLA